MVIPQRTLDHTEIVKNSTSTCSLSAMTGRESTTISKTWAWTCFYFPYGDGVSSTKIKEEVLRNYQDLKSKVETRVNPEVRVNPE